MIMTIYDRRLTILANVPVFDTGFASSSAKASKDWTTVRLSDKKLGAEIQIDYRITCAEGFFGDHCQRSCMGMGSNVICSSNGTVVCAAGWKGKKCDEGKWSLF